ncbi:hypothetical protein DL762_006545 [Monosporascus cannonballus]|uniref:Uncharacterized protein n=1 Tax=Monosporascus cannonballus TaxID=155416 RepID=A0ABY0H2N5_9PEZI|nr:hypothetical protein DL762_006545 [Monosporascus cannonballus]
MPFGAPGTTPVPTAAAAGGSSSAAVPHPGDRGAGHLPALRDLVAEPAPARKCRPGKRPPEEEVRDLAGAEGIALNLIRPPALRAGGGRGARGVGIRPRPRLRLRLSDRNPDPVLGDADRDPDSEAEPEASPFWRCSTSCWGSFSAVSKETRTGMGTGTGNLAQVLDVPVVVLQW